MAIMGVVGASAEGMGEVMEEITEGIIMEDTMVEITIIPM